MRTRVQLRVRAGGAWQRLGGTQSAEGARHARHTARSAARWLVRARRTCHALYSGRIFYSTVTAKRHVWASIALNCPSIGLELTRGAFITLC